MSEATKGTITTETAGEDIKAQPAQGGGSGVLEDEERIELPEVQEAKPEVVASLAKVALARILEDPDVLKKEDDKALLNMHLRLHQLWEAANAGKLELTRPEFLKVHTLVVAEMDRRGMKHSPLDELDKATRRKQSRCFSGDGYNEQYYTGLADMDELFIRDLADVLRWFPDEIGKVLDVGCGMGRALSVLKTSGYVADGSEVSDYAADVCRKQGHEVVKADVTSLPFQDGHYDVVMSMDVLEHVQDFETALRETVRVAGKRAVHLIPLGIRRDASHQHVFKTLNDLRDVVMACDLPVTQMHRTGSNKAVVVIDKEATVGESQIGPYLQDFCVVPEFISLAGGAVKSSSPDDIDIVWRASESIGGMEIALRNLLPEKMREKVHHVYNPQGPHDDHIALFDLVARLRHPRHVSQVAKAALRPNKRFTPLKTASGYTQQEYFAPEEFYEQWAKPFIEEGTRLDVEQKWPGYRTVAEYDGKNTLIYFEDSTDDRSKQLTVIVNELKALGKPVILDMDLHAIYSDGRIVPRVELSGLISKDTKVDDDGKFTTPSGATAHLAARVFDVLYFDDKDLHTLPWTQRRETLNKLFRSVDFKLFKPSPARVVSSKKDLLEEIERVSKKDGSEGAVIKVVTSDYPLTGQTTAWAKVKNVLEIKVEVLDRKPIKGSRNQWNYIVAYTDEHGKLRELGKTFNSRVDAKPGDVLTLSVGEIIPKYNENEKTWTVSAVVPRVQDLETGSVKAEGVESIIRRAYQSNILQVSTGIEDKLRRTVLRGVRKQKENVGPYTALILTAPYGELVWEDKKKLILKSHLYRDMIGTPMFLAQGDKLYGVLELDEPTKIESDEQYSKLKDEHRVPEKEAKRDWGKLAGLYAYPYRWVQKFDEPVRFKRKPGTQTFQSDVVVEDKKAFYIITKQEGSVSFKEGDSGTGILQTHERGLTEEQTKLVHDFGWEPVEFSGAELGQLSDLVGKDVTAAYKAAQDGNSSALGKMVEKVDTSKLSKSQKTLIARASPVSIHTDFRMRPGKETYWEGGEGFTPGNQFQPNKFLSISDGTTPNAKILMNFKIGRDGKVTSSIEDIEQALKPVRGPLGWLTIGRGKPQVFPPGAVGSTEGSYSRFLIRDEVKWRAGVQDKHYKEFEFTGKVLDGRWIMQFVPVGRGESAEQAAGRAWMVSRPSKQEFDSEALKKGLKVLVPILKQDTAKHIVTGIVLKPDTVDAQGDTIAAKDVEEAAHKFMLRYRKGSTVGYMHKDMQRNLQIVESWIAPVALVLNGHDIPAGSWVLSVKVLDADVWAEVLKGKITGFSIGGVAKIRPVE